MLLTLPYVSPYGASRSPRGAKIDGEEDNWDFGTGAGFYLDATEPKWKEHYRMYTYVTKELPALVAANLPVLEDKHSIMGHSMGGHGALVLGLRNPVRSCCLGVRRLKLLTYHPHPSSQQEQYKSISAFAPIVHPTQCPWGVKAFTGYLGVDQEAWKVTHTGACSVTGLFDSHEWCGWQEYDATQLMLKHGPLAKPMLIDQGREDSFLHDKQLLPEAFEVSIATEELTSFLSD
jgi:S-formylglutathione hydrolase